MVITPPPPTRSPIGEQRVAFYGMSWSDYLQVFQALPLRRHTRLSYLSGTLEITMPLEEHEFCLRSIEFFIRILISELGMDMKSMGSTTMNRGDMERGAEPDCAYYIQNQAKVAGRTVNFDVDPPPDLVVEIDMTHTDINKNQLYAAMGVPEFWRYDGQSWRIFCLENHHYLESEISPTFPLIVKEDLYRFLAEADRSEMTAERNLRTHVQELSQI